MGSGNGRRALAIAGFMVGLAGAAAYLATRNPDSRIRVACVGDSVTEGEGVEDPALRYPARLGALLGEGYDVRNFGVGGATTRCRGQALRKANPGARVFLCRPVPVVGVGNFGIRGDVVSGEITDLIDRAGRELGVEVIDLHGALQGRPDLLPDRVHPNGEGARLIADAVHRAITRPRPAG